ncbi:hypothetical protein NEOLEDRAFT_1182422 [Neolentinus lepideus HHB14362 ss-1]|uniref:Uncharacterized protein n=1 Tax=Neolentinus lepideus HHB14362 ss-1 TaxID=1314782 RepID=A0A165P5Z7_9AGAM|nr:hypothetical protein NEOLEDRAFT_1182422 [Neolentinus lepideus HHB14362 ss-1]
MDNDDDENVAETEAIENEEEPLEGYDGDQFDDGDVEADDRIGFMHTKDDMHTAAEFILSDEGDDTYEHLAALRDLTDDEVLRPGHRDWVADQPENSLRNVTPPTIGDAEFENQVLCEANEALGRDNDQLKELNHTLLEKAYLCEAFKDDITRLCACIQELKLGEDIPILMAIKEYVVV